MRQAPGRPDTLKAATVRLVQANGGLAKSAHRVGISRSRLQELIDPKHRAFLDVNHVLTLELACGEAIVTGFLAHEQGAELLTLPRSHADHRLNITMARIGEALAQLFASYERAVADNRIDRRSVPKLIENVDDALSRLTELRGHLQVRRPS